MLRVTSLNRRLNRSFRFLASRSSISIGLLFLNIPSLLEAERLRLGQTASASLKLGKWVWAVEILIETEREDESEEEEGLKRQL